MTGEDTDDLLGIMARHWPGLDRSGWRRALLPMERDAALDFYTRLSDRHGRDDPPRPPGPRPDSWLVANRGCRCGASLYYLEGANVLHCRACNTVKAMESWTDEKGVRKHRVLLEPYERGALVLIPEPGAEGPVPSPRELLSGVIERIAAGREARGELWRRARHLERQGRQIDWSKLSGDGCLPVSEGHDYLAGISAPAASEGSA